jgi:hypothetical protein
VVWVVPMDQMVRVVRVVQRTWTTWTNGCGWSGSGPGRPPFAYRPAGVADLPHPPHLGLIRRFRPVSAGSEAIVLRLFRHMLDFRRVLAEVRGLLNLGASARGVC